MNSAKLPRNRYKPLKVSSKQKWPTASLHIVFWYLLKVLDKILLPSGQNNNVNDFYEKLYLNIEEQLNEIYQEKKDYNLDRKLIHLDYPLISMDTEMTEMTDLDLRRLNKACLLQILIILHNKLEHLRKKTLSGSKTHSQLFPSKDLYSSSERQQKELFNKVEDLLNKYGY